LTVLPTNLASLPQLEKLDLRWNRFFNQHNCYVLLSISPLHSSRKLGDTRHF